MFEVFGPVKQPLYTIRLLSPRDLVRRMPPPKATATSEDDGDAPTEAEPLVPPEDEDADPWAEDGRHTKLLRGHPSIDVYFVRDEARLIDTSHVIQLSGKGCDASNLYDEELNANEIDYSDDEEERSGV